MKYRDIVEEVNLKNILISGIGGVAKFFIDCRSEEAVKRGIKWALLNKINFRVMGGGTNILMEEVLFEELIMKINLRGIKLIDSTLTVLAGTPLKDLITFCLKNRLRGLEGLAGIPGSIGGAIFKNSSTRWAQISERLVEIKVLDKRGESFTLKKREIPFSYRDSGLKNFIILGATFKLEKTKEDLERRVKEIINYRKNTQPVDKRSMGCVFKNSLEFTAGFLIEKANLKGLRIGRVEVSRKHANFFIIEEGATFEDFYSLMERVKEEVKKKTGLTLEPDIVIWRR